MAPEFENHLLKKLAQMPRKINTSRFYFEWRGHQIDDVRTFHSTTASLRPGKPIIYLAGDSSLDNKYWVQAGDAQPEASLRVETPEIYRAILDRPDPKLDVGFWLNHFLGSRATALNLAVEASTLQERKGELLEHDGFVRDHITENDVLVVSIGGNDIALKPTPATICHMLLLAWVLPRFLLKRGFALGHFVRMFRDQVQAYVSRLVEKKKPLAVVICMIYYPLEAKASKQSSWADLPLRLLGYNLFPGQLQTAIKKMYELATTKIEIPGIKVIPCPLFEIMDGRSHRDYESRVEPSEEGGRKMALHLTELIDPFIRAA